MAQKVKTPEEEIKRIEFEYFLQRGASLTVCRKIKVSTRS